MQWFHMAGYVIIVLTGVVAYWRAKFRRGGPDW
jgi:hypothetical protein